MGERLSKKEALAYIRLDDKSFMNYLGAGEFTCLERNGKGIYYFDKDILNNWAQKRKSRTVDLTKEDYALCLDFALAQHFRNYVMSDFGSGRQREFGQKITNWIKGQLGEVAVKKFFKEKFNFNIELDFEIHDEIVPQDIIKAEGRNPKIGVGIKSSKPKNVYLVLGENEITRPERRSDVYIYCRPNIPDDHLLRITKDAIISLVKGEPHFSKYKDNMPDFQDIPCEVVGWCKYDELVQVSEIPGQKFDGTRFVIASGKLKGDLSDWKNLIEMI